MPEGENSEIGNDMERNSEQGSLGVAETHSLSGMTNSDAVIRYCAGRTTRISEKTPSETVRTRRWRGAWFPPHPQAGGASQASGADRQAAMDSGISPARPSGMQAQSHGSMTRQPSTMGSTTSTTAVGTVRSL